VASPHSNKCFEVIRDIYKNELGISLPNYESVEEGLEDKHWREIETPQAFDIVIFKNKHVGLVLNEFKFIHHTKWQGVVINTFDSQTSEKIFLRWRKQQEN